MRVNCWSCGRKVSDLVPTCEFCGANRRPRNRIQNNFSSVSNYRFDESAIETNTLRDPSIGFGFWPLMLLLFNAVWDLMIISIIGGLGYVLFFTGLLTDIPFWVLLPIKAYLTIMGFLLYFKPSIVAWNLNRDLTSYSLFSLVLGERLSYAIIVLLRFMLFPILLPITLAVVVPIAFIAILLQYVFNPDYVRPRPDYRSLAKSYFFPQPMINADGQLRRTALDDGIIVSPGLRLNPFYYTGIKARVQHRYFVVIFFVNLILGATGVIWLGTHVFAHMGLWTHREEFEGVLKTGFEPHVSESAS